MLGTLYFLGNPNLSEPPGLAGRAALLCYQKLGQHVFDQQRLYIADNDVALLLYTYM